MFKMWSKSCREKNYKILISKLKKIHRKRPSACWLKRWIKYYIIKAKSYEWWIKLNDS